MENNISKKVEDFFSKFTLLEHKKGDIILRAESPPPGIFYLKKGLVRQYIVSKKGEILVIHIFRSGSFFQMTWAINEAQNSFYYEAITPVTIYRSPLKDVKEFLKKEPEILYSYTSRLLKGMNGLLKRLEYLVLDPAYVKTASLLYYFAKNFGEKDGGGIAIKLPLTHREIASWIGTTRETASLQIEDFKKKGLITTRGRTLIVKDIDKMGKEASLEFINPDSTAIN